MKSVTNLKISISGVRAVVGDALTPLLMVRFAQAFGTWTGSGTVVVGSDTRTSGEMVRHAVLSGLTSAGCQVVDLGICPVPTVQVMVERLGAAGGIAITASHNPVEWNALKFIRGDGIFLNAYQAEELLAIYHQGEFTRAESAALRRPRTNGDAVKTHVAAILKLVDAEKIRARRFRVAVDCCNGAGAVATPHLLEVLGCEMLPIHLTPNGIFPHPPEPIPENLGDLCAHVRATSADVGFAQDADADRLAIVSEEGAAIGEEYSVALCTDFVLRRRPGTVVVNVSTSMMAEEIAARYGARVIRTAVGEVNVAERMKRERAAIGGEGNGGVIYPPLHYGRDSFIGMALVLESMAESGRPLSEMARALPQFFMAKKKVPIASERVPPILAHIREKYASYELDLTDGIKILGDRWWAQVRASRTEPVIRVMVEAPTEGEAERLAGELMGEMG
ncbi:MAG: phosphoglucosamine mutase [Armatimonadetes bacterium]|nr:phosphoglucosamine mutase [Armatimonadota bacterium]